MNAMLAVGGKYQLLLKLRLIKNGISPKYLNSSVLNRKLYFDFLLSVESTLLMSTENKPVLFKVRSAHTYILLHICALAGWCLEISMQGIHMSPPFSVHSFLRIRIPRAGIEKMDCLAFWVSKKLETLRHNALKREIFASLGILDSEGEEEANSKVSCSHRPVRLPGLRLWGRGKG